MMPMLSVHVAYLTDIFSEAMRAGLTIILFHAQVPSTWRGIIEDPATLQLFLDFYAASQPPLSSMALECLVRPLTAHPSALP